MKSKQMTYRILFVNGHTARVREDNVVFMTGAENIGEIAARNRGKDIINKDNVLKITAEEDDAK